MNNIILSWRNLILIFFQNIWKIENQKKSEKVEILEFFWIFEIFENLEFWKFPTFTKFRFFQIFFSIFDFSDFLKKKKKSKIKFLHDKIICFIQFFSWLGLYFYYVENVFRASIILSGRCYPPKTIFICLKKRNFSGNHASDW